MWILLFAVLWAATPTAPDPWASRTENGAVRLREATDALAATADGIAKSGRLEQLAVLHSDADEAARRADQLIIWADQAPSLVQSVPATVPRKLEAPVKPPERPHEPRQPR